MPVPNLVVPEGLRLEGLRIYRQLARLTQVELARRVGLTPMTISHLERGTMSPRLSTARRLAQVLGAPSVEALFPEPPARASTARRRPVSRRKEGG